VSIFDAIKYPISFPPSEAELRALPKHIYETWINHPKCTWKNTDKESSYDFGWVSGWMRSYYIDTPVAEEITSDTNLLIQIIKDIE
jgi:hypothetical protein